MKNSNKSEASIPELIERVRAHNQLMFGIEASYTMMDMILRDPEGVLELEKQKKYVETALEKPEDLEMVKKLTMRQRQWNYALLSEEHKRMLCRLQVDIIEGREPSGEIFSSQRERDRYQDL